jgi:F0F1-type ATP synthase assembly protein I
MANSSEDKPKLEGLRTAGLLLSIPALLVAAPLAGLFIGMAVDRWLGTKRVFSAIGVGLGFAAAGRETYRIYRRLQNEEERKGR